MHIPGAWDPRSCQGKPTVSSSAPGVGRASWASARSGVIGALTAATQCPGQAPDLPPPSSIWPAHQRGPSCALSWECLVEAHGKAWGAGHPPQRGLPSLPADPVWGSPRIALLDRSLLSAAGSGVRRWAGLLCCDSRVLLGLSCPTFKNTRHSRHASTMRGQNRRPKGL